MIIFIATARKDDSDDGYFTVYKKAHKTRRLAESALNRIFANVKSIEEVELE